MSSRLGKLFTSFRRRKEENGGEAAVAEEAAANNPVLVELSDESGASSSVFKDAGADRYRELLRQREMKAQLRANGGHTPHPEPAVVTSADRQARGAGGKGQDKQVAQAGKVRAKRLMKELRDVKRSSAVTTDDIFDVDLHDENLFEWDVWLKKFDPESKLAMDLKNLGSAQNVCDVWIRISFPDNYPFSPPFVRVLAPNIQGGFVLSGGAICMELLTPDGWSQAYTVEAVIHQTMSTMVKGDARVVAHTARPFTQTEAKRSYDYLVKTHKKHGWHTPAMKEG